MDGATSVISKSISNLIVHTPSPFSFEYLRANLQRENFTNVAEKISSFIDRLNNLAGFASIFAFVSDSCNATCDVHTLLVEKKFVRFTYGCFTHCVNNICEELGKVYFSKSTKKVLFVTKSIRHQHLLRRVFESVCEERCCMKLTLLLYSKTPWSSINRLFARLQRCKPALSYLRKFCTMRGTLCRLTPISKSHKKC